MEVRCEPQDLWIFVHFLLIPELGNKKKHFGRAGFEPIIASSGESKEKAAVNGPFQTCLFGGSNSRVF